MGPLRTAVIGVGYLGKFHAQKYAQLPESELVAVVDAEADRAAEVAQATGARAVRDYRELVGQVDAVSVVVPTPLHHAVTDAFLRHGTDVLVEKPMTQTVAEAEDLIAVAESHGRILQVGHLERFNTATLALHDMITRPVFIENHRLAPFKPRGLDVSVVLDLMIHDIDLILEVTQAPLTSVVANGAPVISSEVDIANARLVFADGCVANVTASRVSDKTERKMRIFQRETYLSVDFHERRIRVHRKGDGEMYPGIPQILTDEHSFEHGDALLTEIQLFLKAARERSAPVVGGEAGKRALETAILIGDLLRETNAPAS